MSVKDKVVTGLLALSVAGAVFITHMEGTELRAYPDSIGVATICTGHTKDVQIGDVATPEQCLEYLAEDVEDATEDVRRCTTAPVTQAQMDALISLTFNIGGANYCRSTLVKKLNAGNCNGAANEFQKWVYADGKKLNGLVNRRREERKMFLTGCP